VEVHGAQYTVSYAILCGLVSRLLLVLPRLRKVNLKRFEFKYSGSVAVNGSHRTPIFFFLISSNTFFISSQANLLALGPQLVCFQHSYCLLKLKVSY
jgi:hypothetical protein